MPETLYVADLTYAYIGLLGAFIAAQLLLMTRDNRVQVGLWLAASLFSALGTINTPSILNIFDVGNLSLYGILAAQVGGLFRFLALSYRKRSFNTNRLAEKFVLMSVLAIPLIAVPALSPYKLLIGSCIGVSTSAACLFAALGNPTLKFVNKQPVSLIVSATALGIGGLIYRASTAFPFSTDQVFIGASATQRLGMTSLILVSFVLQVGFTGVMAEQRQREATRKDRAAVRTRQRTQRLQERAVETARVARARLDLVQLLTHEVRQPISNAQASLQKSTSSSDPRREFRKMRPLRWTARKHRWTRSPYPYQTSSWLPQFFLMNANGRATKSMFTQNWKWRYWIFLQINDLSSKSLMRMIISFLTAFQSCCDWRCRIFSVMQSNCQNRARILILI